MYRQNELMHYGVLGMKWGHRKARKEFSAEANAKARAKQAQKQAKKEAKQLKRDIKDANWHLTNAEFASIKRQEAQRNVAAYNNGKTFVSDFLRRNAEKQVTLYGDEEKTSYEAAKKYIAKLDKTKVSMITGVHKQREEVKYWDDNSYVSEMYTWKGNSIASRSDIAKSTAKSEAKLNKIHSKYTSAYSKDPNSRKTARLSKKEDKLLERYGEYYDRTLDVENDRIKLKRKNVYSL